MGKLLSGMFGGGSAKREAAEAAAQSRAQQQVANDRQLGALAKDDAAARPLRRNPRGRRLFAADDDKKTLG